MTIVPFILQCIALFCLLCAALNLLATVRVVWGWAGMFFWLLSLMVGGLVLHPIAH